MRYSEIADKLIRHLRAMRPEDFQNTHRGDLCQPIYYLGEEIGEDQRKVYLTVHEMADEKPEWFKVYTREPEAANVVCYKNEFDFRVEDFLENGGFTEKKRKADEEEVKRRNLEELDINSKTQVLVDSKHALSLAKRANRIAIFNVIATILAVLIAWYLGRY